MVGWRQPNRTNVLPRLAFVTHHYDLRLRNVLIFDRTFHLANLTTSPPGFSDN